MLYVNDLISVPLSDIEIDAIRAQGAGGQKINKTSSAVHLRFDIRQSALPEDCRQRLLTLRDHRITAEGVVVIKAQRLRTQEANRADALNRLADLIRKAASTPPPRKPTRPTHGSKLRRLDSKVSRGRLKALRGRVSD